MRPTASIVDHVCQRLADVSGLPARVQRLRDLVSQTIVRDAATLDAVQALRYAAFRHEGTVRSNRARRLGDRFDLSPNGASFAICLDGHLCATIRLHRVDARCSESPACAVFGDRLLPLLAQGACLIDPNSFCVDPALRGSFPEFAYLALRLPFLAAGLAPHAHVTATVRAEHAAFYRRELRCRLVAGPRAYPGRTSPLALMLVDYQREAAAVIARRPLFAAAPGEALAIGLGALSHPDAVSERTGVAAA